MQLGRHLGCFAQLYCLTARLFYQHWSPRGFQSQKSTKEPSTCFENVLSGTTARLASSRGLPPERQLLRCLFATGPDRWRKPGRISVRGSFALDRDLPRARSETDNVRAPGGPHDPTERETEHYLREAGADASAEEEIKQYLQEKERMRPLTALLRAHGDWHGLDVLAKLGPADLIEALWTWVEEAALMLSTPASPGFLRSEERR